MVEEGSQATYIAAARSMALSFQIVSRIGGDFRLVLLGGDTWYVSCTHSLF